MILKIILYKFIVISTETRGKQNIEISYLVYLKGWHFTDTLSNKTDLLKVWVSSFFIYRLIIFL